MEERTCTRCIIPKPIEQFYLSSRIRDGKLYVYRFGYCDECRRLAGKNHYQTHKPEHKKRIRNNQLKQYGLAIESRNALLAAQGGRCAICPATKPGGRGDWHTDHDHVTGKVRGILCCSCNRMLGLAKDSATVLEAAATYLRSTTI